MYTLSKNFMYQRHYDVPKNMPLYDYVRNNLGKKFDVVYYVVANIKFTHNFNLTGGLIIEELKYGKTADEIAQKLNKLYKIEYCQMKSDVIDFISFLESIKVLINEEGK